MPPPRREHSTAQAGFLKVGRRRPPHIPQQRRRDVKVAHHRHVALEVAAAVTDMADAGLEVIEAAHDRGGKRESGRERRHHAQHARRAIGHAELADEGHRVVTLDAEDRLRREARLDLLAHAGDEETHPARPKRPPLARQKQDRQIVMRQTLVDIDRAQRQNESQQKNAGVVHRAPSPGMENSMTSFIEQLWDKDIVPTLTDYIRIPNKSPAFDPKWVEHGHMDKVVAMFEGWAREKLKQLPGSSLEVVRLKDRTPLIFIEVPGNNK